MRPRAIPCAVAAPRGDAIPEEPEAREARPSPRRRALAPSLTGLSAASLPRRRSAPMQRSGTVMSALSMKTVDTERSVAPPGVDVGGLRGHFSVGYYTQWPVQEDYEFTQRLGEGGFGQVWRATERATGAVVAIKVIPALTVRDAKRYEREIKVFERLSSPYLVKLHSIFKDDERLYLVMDLCTGGDLMEYLMGYFDDPDFPERREDAQLHPEDNLVLDEAAVGPLLWQMLAGVLYLHHNRFAHRDIKLENYMLKAKCEHPQVQLCDFGLSVRIGQGERISGSVGTLLYMAPEVLRGRYDTKCDIWSVGVSAYLLATMHSPWGSPLAPEEVRRRILLDDREAWPSTRPEVPPRLRELIDRMLTASPDSRPSAQVLFRRSPWLRRWGTETKGALHACAVS